MSAVFVAVQIDTQAPRDPAALSVYDKSNVGVETLKKLTKIANPECVQTSRFRSDNDVCDHPKVGLRGASCKTFIISDIEQKKYLF